MSGYPSSRPVSPVGRGYYDVRDIRPDNYERQRDVENLNRYGTIRRTNGPPIGHPSERAFPELRRTLRYEDSYGAAGANVSSNGGSVNPMVTQQRPLYNMDSRYPILPMRRDRPQPRPSSSRRTHRSSHRSSNRSLEPVADLGFLAGDFRPYNTPTDGFERRPPPRDYSQVDELDLYDSGAPRQRYASPSRRSPRPSAAGLSLPSPEEFAASTSSRGGQYPSDNYGRSQQPSPRYYSEYRRPG